MKLRTPDVIETAMVREAQRIAPTLLQRMKGVIVIESDTASLMDLNGVTDVNVVVELLNKMVNQLYDRMKEVGGYPVKSWAIVTREQGFPMISFQVECKVAE